MLSGIRVSKSLEGDMPMSLSFHLIRKVVKFNIISLQGKKQETYGVTWLLKAAYLILAAYLS